MTLNNEMLALAIHNHDVTTTTTNAENKQKSLDIVDDIEHLNQ